MTKNSTSTEKELINQVSILSRALPYMQKYSKKNITIKFGGAPMGASDLSSSFAKDITLIKQVGINPIIIHGGGPKIQVMLDQLNLKTKFVDGLRVTDKESMRIIEMVLSGSINKEIVMEINKEGGQAIGFSGKDALLVKTERVQKNIKNKEGLGFVGKPKKINRDFLLWCLESDFIPVISPIGVGEDYQTFNINADTLAGSVASEISSERLILLTDVRGVLDRNKKVLSHISIKEVKKLISNGIITGGMIPKVKTCVRAIENGVKAAVILDGTFPHAILLEIFTDHGAGTLITK